MVSNPVEGRRYKHIETCTLWVLESKLLKLDFNSFSSFVFTLKREKLPRQPWSIFDLSLTDYIQYDEKDFKGDFIEW